MFKFHQKCHNRNFMILTLLERWFDMDLLLDSQDNKESYLRCQVHPLTQLIVEVPSIFLWPQLEYIGLKPIMNTVVLAYSIPSGNYTLVFLWRTHTSPTLSTFASRSSISLGYSNWFKEKNMTQARPIRFNARTTGRKRFSSQWYSCSVRMWDWSCASLLVLIKEPLV